METMPWFWRATVSAWMRGPRSGSRMAGLCSTGLGRAGLRAVAAGSVGNVVGQGVEAVVAERGGVAGRRASQLIDVGLAQRLEDGVRPGHRRRRGGDGGQAKRGCAAAGQAHFLGSTRAE